PPVLHAEAGGHPLEVGDRVVGIADLVVAHRIVRPARSGLEIPGVMTEPVEPGRDLHVHPGHPGVGIAGQSSDYDDAEWRHEGWDLSPAWINEVRRRVSRQTELTADLAQLGPAASAPRPKTTT